VLKFNVNKGFFIDLILVSPFFLVFALFIVAPFSVSVYYSLTRGSGFTLENYIKIFTSESYRDAIRNSLLISLKSSALSLVLGTFIAYALTFLPPSVRDLIKSILLLPIIYPGLVIAFSLVLLFGSSGIVTNILRMNFNIDLPSVFNVRSYDGLILAYLSFLVGFVTITLSGVFLSFDKTLVEAGRSLGAGPLRVAFKIVFPIISPALIAAFIQVFIIALSAYGTALALIGGIGNLITLRIITVISDVAYDPHLAAALAMVIAMVSIPSSIIYGKLLKKVVGGVV
jgi:putative spermidine/putrescine transport system permease protein